MVIVGHEAVDLGAFDRNGVREGMVDQRAVAVLQAQTAGAALIAHVPFIALCADRFGLPRGAGSPQPQPSSCSRSSSMPKWWAISWITVMATSSTT